MDFMFRFRVAFDKKRYIKKYNGRMKYIEEVVLRELANSDNAYLAS